MRAAVVEGGRFVVADLPDPEPGPGQLLLRVSACGICGSDLKMAPWMPDGTVMGHELAGEVVAVGAGVEGWPDGTPVAALPVAGCGRCAACHAGDPARCPEAGLVGVGGPPGAFAELVRVEAGEATRLPDGVPVEHGALAEPLAVGLHAVARAHLRPGADVLVVGAGPVGQAVTLWAHRLGARSVTASDPAAARRAAAAAYGAARTIDPTAEELGGPYDVVIECVGAPGMMTTCLDAVRPGGRIVIAGVCVEPDPFVPGMAVLKDVDVAFVSYYTRAEFDLAARLLGELDVATMVTGRVDLDGLDAAVADLRTPTDQRKVLVVP